jgi:hypothetical protein
MNVLLLLIKWKWALLAVGLAVLLAIPVLYVRGAERAKERLVHIEQELGKATANAATNSQSFLKCSLVNDENAKEADRQKVRADQALLRLAKLEGSINVRLGEINHEASLARGRDTECRTLDSVLPEWFVAGLRQPTS